MPAGSRRTSCSSSPTTRCTRRSTRPCHAKYGPLRAGDRRLRDQGGGRRGGVPAGPAPRPDGLLKARARATGATASDDRVRPPRPPPGRRRARRRPAPLTRSASTLRGRTWVGCRRDEDLLPAALVVPRRRGSGRRRRRDPDGPAGADWTNDALGAPPQHAAPALVFDAPAEIAVRRSVAGPSARRSGGALVLWADAAYWAQLCRTARPWSSRPSRTSTPTTATPWDVDDESVHLRVVRAAPPGRSTPRATARPGSSSASSASSRLPVGVGFLAQAPLGNDVRGLRPDRARHRARRPARRS